MTRDKNLYIYAWAASPLVFFFAFGYTQFPNQLYFACIFGLTVLGIILIHSGSLTAVGVSRLLIPILLYYLAFYIVSFWELFPGTTIEHGKFEVLNLFNAFAAYLIGRNYRPEHFLVRYYRLGVAVIIITIMQLILDSEVSRYGYGVQLMLCLPVALLMERYLIIFLGIAVMLASDHKTTLVSGIVALITAYFFIRNRSVRSDNSQVPSLINGKSHRTGPSLKPVYMILAILVAATAVLFFADRVASTIGRFLPDGSLTIFGLTIESEGLDYTRQYVSEATLTLFSQYFLKGIGYMNFYAWTGLDAGIFYTTNLDRDVTGVNLHNSYATWILEGGILVVITVLLLFYLTAKRIVVLLASRSYRSIGIVAASWASSLLLYSGYQQGHMTMQFWSVIGLIFGFYAQHLSQKQAQVRSPRGIRYDNDKDFAPYSHP